MAIDVEISLVPMHAFANVISQPTDRENIASAIQRYPISEVEALACEDFFMDRFKPSIVSLEGMRRGHHFDDTSAQCSMASGLDLKRQSTDDMYFQITESPLR